MIAAAIAAACASSTPDLQRWAVRVVSTDGRYVGGVVLEMTPRPASMSCSGETDLRLARIIEKHGFAHDRVGDHAAVRLKDGKLFADLSPGICDHTLVISGTVRGRRAIGEASRSTAAGWMKVGTFSAEQR